MQVGSLNSMTGVACTLIIYVSLCRGYKHGRGQMKGLGWDGEGDVSGLGLWAPN